MSENKLETTTPATAMPLPPTAGFAFMDRKATIPKIKPTGGNQNGAYKRSNSQSADFSFCGDYSWILYGWQLLFLILGANLNPRLLCFSLFLGVTKCLPDRRAAIWARIGLSTYLLPTFMTGL